MAWSILHLLFAKTLPIFVTKSMALLQEDCVLVCRLFEAWELASLLFFCHSEPCKSPECLLYEKSTLSSTLKKVSLLLGYPQRQHHLLLRRLEYSCACKPFSNYIFKLILTNHYNSMKNLPSCVHVCMCICVKG